MSIDWAIVDSTALLRLRNVSHRGATPASFTVCVCSTMRGLVFWSFYFLFLLNALMPT